MTTLLSTIKPPIINDKVEIKGIKLGNKDTMELHLQIDYFKDENGLMSFTLTPLRPDVKITINDVKEI